MFEGVVKQIIRFCGRTKASLFVCMISGYFAYAGGLINLQGLYACLGFYLLTILYFQVPFSSLLLKLGGFTVLVMVTTLFLFRFIPGFHNVLVLDQITLSPLSTTFSMYVNIDKIAAAIIIFMNSGLYQKEKIPKLFLVKKTVKCLLFLIAMLMGISLLSGYIKFDIKIPDILFVWSFTNLFFVCFAEEVIFRGMIQSQLSQWVSDKFFLLLLSSMIFGCYHVKGGFPLMILSSIAGFFYGFIYAKTRSLSCAIGMHFCLNFAHLIFFTYPAAVRPHAVVHYKEGTLLQPSAFRKAPFHSSVADACVIRSSG